jgi:hypothetical protein
MTDKKEEESKIPLATPPATAPETKPRAYIPFQYTGKTYQYPYNTYYPYQYPYYYDPAYAAYAYQGKDYYAPKKTDKKEKYNKKVVNPPKRPKDRKCTPITRSIRTR